MTSSWSVSDPLRADWSCPPTGSEGVDFFHPTLRGRLSFFDRAAVATAIVPDMESESGIRRDLVLAAVEMMGREGREGTVRVQGDSMRPTLVPDQLLAVQFTSSARHGDMLLFHQGGQLLVHRLLGAAPPLDGRPRLRTRGDGVLKLDPPVDLDRVVGRVVAFRDGGRWRSTEGLAARAYGRCLAWHDFFWAGVGAMLRRVSIGRRVFPAVEAIDRALIRLPHHLLYRRVHREVPGPVRADPVARNAR
jgi:hypothetical protein